MEKFTAGFLKLEAKNYVHAFLTGAFTAVVPVLYQASQEGLDIFSYDWASVLRLAISAGIGYLLKKLMTTEKGEVLGLVKE